MIKIISKIKSIVSDRWQQDSESPPYAPPTCPEEMEVGPPDFVGLGAQKAGTTWWYKLIVKHPNVFVPNFDNNPYPSYFTKERHYFDNFFESPFETGHVDDYEKWFPRPEGMCTGDWTPRYLVDIWTASLLAKSAPQVKLLVLLRDPIDRFVSGMAHWQRYHQLSADDAITHYMRGRYSQQLEHWLEYFPVNQFLFLQYEKCKKNPRRELKRTFDFLGLSEFKVSEQLLKKKVNARRSQTSYTLPSHFRESLVRSYTADVKALKILVPELNLRLWPNFSHLTASKTIQSEKDSR